MIGDGIKEKLDMFDGLDLISDEFDFDVVVFEFDDVVFDGLEEVVEFVVEGFLEGLMDEILVGELLVVDVSENVDFLSDFLKF